MMIFSIVDGHGAGTTVGGYLLLLLAHDGGVVVRFFGYGGEGHIRFQKEVSQGFRFQIGRLRARFFCDQ